MFLQLQNVRCVYFEHFRELHGHALPKHFFFNIAVYYLFDFTAYLYF